MSREGEERGEGERGEWREARGERGEGEWREAKGERGETDTVG